MRKTQYSKSFLCLICLILFSVCSYQVSAKFNPKDIESQTLLMKANQVHYHFLFNLPKGWKTAFENKLDNGFMNEYIPANQDLASWRDMVSLRVDGIAAPSDYNYFHTLLSRKSPINQDTCKGFKHSEFTDYEQFGIKTIEFYVECPSSIYTPGSGEVNLYKYMLAGDKVGLISMWKSWKIKNNADLEKARAEYADYTKLFRTVNLKAI